MLFRSRLLVVRRELGRLRGDSLEDVVDERVEDGHGLVGDSSVGVDLLEDLVDVRRVRLNPSLVLLFFLPVSLGGLLGSGGLLRGLLGGRKRRGGTGRAEVSSPLERTPPDRPADSDTPWKQEEPSRAPWRQWSRPEPSG